MVVRPIGSILIITTQIVLHRYTKCTHLSVFSLVACHDDDTHVILPHHAPQVNHCLSQWSLRSYVCPLT